MAVMRIWEINSQNLAPGRWLAVEAPIWKISPQGLANAAVAVAKLGVKGAELVEALKPAA